MKRLIHYSLLPILMAAAVLILLMPIYAPGASGGASDPRESGGGGEEKVISNQTLILDNDLVVDSVVVLRNTTLLFNCSYNGEYGIRIEPGGTLFVLNNSKIGAAEKGRFTLRVVGEKKRPAGLIVRESTISGCGYPSTDPENAGIYISMGTAEFTDSHIKNGYYGILLSGIENEAAVENTEFSGNEIGVYLQWTENINIGDCRFVDNAMGLKAVHSSRLAVTGSTFENNALGGILFDNSTLSEVKGNILSGNAGGGISAVSSSHLLIQDNRIEDSRERWYGMLGTGIRLNGGTSFQIKNNKLFGNDIGLMMLHNISNSQVEGLEVSGGRLGVYLYDLNLPLKFDGLSVAGSMEAGFSARYCRAQELREMSITDSPNLGLNVTASELKLVNPRLEGRRFVDKKSTVHLFQEFRVQTWEKSGLSVPYCDVKVKVGEDVIYASGGYGGVDDQTDETGSTAIIAAEYSTITGWGENLSRICVFVRGRGQELNTSFYGEIEPVVRFYLRVADLTISEKDIIVVPPEPSTYGKAEIKVMVSNSGSRSAGARVSVYLLSGAPSIDTGVIVAHIRIPAGAYCIGKNTTFVKERATRTVRFDWKPESEGDYTVLVVVDREMEVIELRKDNNAALIHVHIKEGEAPLPPTAQVNMSIPEALNNSTISSQYLNIPVYLQNDGDIQGSVVLKVTLYQQAQKNQNNQENAASGENTIFMRPYTIPAGKGLTVTVPVSFSSGDAVVNFTLTARNQDGNLRILNPFFSLIFHLRETPFPAAEKTDNTQETVVYTSASGIAAFLVAYIIFSEPARYPFLLLFAPLYMRLSKKDISEQYARGEILGYIKQNPGESYNNIKRDLGMPNGTLAYHLSVLEKGGYIKSAKDGMYRRYYPRKMRVNPYGRITRVQEEILLRIEETPGISQKDLSALVGLSTATINYHIRKLSEKGIISVKKKGIFVHYYLNGMTVAEVMRKAIPPAGQTESG